jgi:hypothetical protein
MTSLRWIIAKVAAVATVAGVVTMVAADTAKAATYESYVCNVVYENPGTSSTFGTYGRVWVDVYDGPGCTGSYQGSPHICSKGATSSTCGTYLHTDVAMHGLMQSLQRAADSNQKVTLTTSGTWAVIYASFHAD